MGVKNYIFFLAFFILVKGHSQYLSNPSFEDDPDWNSPPSVWSTCSGGGGYDLITAPWSGVDLLATNGATYLGIHVCPICTMNSTQEAGAQFTTPLSVDSCYVFQVDLAKDYYSGTDDDLPTYLNIYGSDVSCGKDVFLWGSPGIEEDEWVTYQFLVQPEEFDLHYINLEAVYTEETAPWGYMCVDNIRITRVPQVDLGNDTTIVVCDSGAYELTPINLISPGSGFSSYLWMDGSEDSVYVVDSSGFYSVEVTGQYGCIASDFVNITIMENGSVETFMEDTLSICEGEEIEVSVVGYGGPEPYTYEWLGLPDTTPTVILHPEISTTYYVIVSDTCEQSVTDSVFIDVVPAPEIFLGSDTIVCESTSLELNAGDGYENYLWQDGSNGSSHSASKSGIYWVKGSSGVCNKADTIEVTFDVIPDAFLGNDTSYCAGETVLLSPGSGYTNYLWQDGSTDASYSVSQEGVYWVVITTACGKDSSGIDIGYYDPIVVDLGEDTSICFGENIYLNAGVPYGESYVWQDGSESQYYTIYESGIFTVNITTLYGCTGSSSLAVEVGSIVDLGPDTAYCEGESVILDAGYTFDNYAWNNGETDQLLEVSTSGTYIVDVSYSYGCPSSDTINITESPQPEAIIEGENNFCEGEYITLSGPEGEYNYFWNNVLGEKTLTVDQEGTYELTVVNYCGEDNTELFVGQYSLPHIDLGGDLVLQPGESIELDAGAGFVKYLWQDGSNSRYYMVSDDNIDPDYPFFTVEVWDEYCKNSDIIKIEVFKLIIPSVITPNGDGSNDLFKPKPDGWSAINKHTMVIYNRWGAEVWESSDFESGWDGKSNGTLVAEGTYFWVLEVYYGSDNIKQVIKGSVTVLGSQP